MRSMSSRSRNADDRGPDTLGHALVGHVCYRDRPDERARPKLKAVRRRRRRVAETTSKLKPAA